MSSHVKRGPTGASPKANHSTTTQPHTIQSGPATFVFVFILDAPSIREDPCQTRGIDLTRYSYCGYTPWDAVRACYLVAHLRDVASQYRTPDRGTCSTLTPTQSVGGWFR